MYYQQQTSLGVAWLFLRLTTAILRNESVVRHEYTHVSEERTTYHSKLLDSYLPGLLFDPEDGDGTFLRNVG
jgi:hypothetical protein